MEHKTRSLQQLEEEKNNLEDNNYRPNDEETVNHKKKYEYMKTYIEHRVEQVRDQMNNKIENNFQNSNGSKWHPNDVELVQALVSANRYSFQNMNSNEQQFQENIKRQKINAFPERNRLIIKKVIPDSKKTIHTKRWNADIHITPIVSQNLDKNITKSTNPLVGKTFLHI